MKLVNVFEVCKSFICAPTDFKQCEDWADQETQRLRADLAEKRKKAIEYLGDRWILHPTNAPKRLDVKPFALHK